MATSDEYERYYAERLWSMIPEVYRFEDSSGSDQGALRQIVEVIATDAARARRSIDRLWEDQHIETADDWAVPYLGDLVGTRLLPTLDSRGRRVDVARTTHFRRRRGTPAMLEGIAGKVSGWDVLLVEAYRRLVRTPHRLDEFPVEEGRHTGTPRAGTADLRTGRARELTGTAFDEYFRTPDPRPLRGKRGRFHLSKVNFHLFRQQAYPLVGVTPARMQDPGLVTFTFDPSGRDVPLFGDGQTGSSATDCGPPWSEASLDQSSASTGDGSECDPRCMRREEWSIAQALSCRLYSHAVFLIRDTDIALIGEGGALTESDEKALQQLQDYPIVGESRLRFLLTQMGLDFDPVPTWYRSLLELTVLPDSGAAVISDEGSGSLVFEAEEDALGFMETTGAHLGSRACHPVPKGPLIRVLVHPELGRFAFPQPQAPLSVVDDPTPKPDPAPDPDPTGSDGTDSDADTSDADGDGGDGVSGDGDTSEGDHTGEGDTGGDHTGEGDTGGDHTGEGDTGGDHTGEGDTGGDHTGEGDSSTGPGPSTADLVLYAASGGLQIADRVLTHTSGVFAPIASGGGPVSLGTDSWVGSTWSQGNVSFANRARVNGFVKTAGTISSLDPAPDISDLANTQEGTSLDFSPLSALLDFTVTFPDHGNVDHILTYQDLPLSPGSYRTVSVSGGATLRLSSGIYYFQTLTMDSSSNLRISATGGPVYIFVQSSLTHRAVTLMDVGTAADLIFVVMTPTVILDSWASHFGIVIVPQGTLVLQQARVFHGSFYAQTIETRADQNYYVVPWDGTLPGVEYAAPGAFFAGSTVMRSLMVGGASSNEYTVSISLPDGLSLDDVALFADGGALSVDANIVQVESGPGAIVGTAAAMVTIGSGANVGSVWSGGDVTILSGARVDGDVTATAAVNDSGTVTGTTSTAGFSTTEVLQFTVTFGSGPDQTIGGSEPVRLSSGEYGVVRVLSGGTLILGAGQVRCTELHVEMGAQVHLDLTSALTLNVQNELTLDGDWRVIWGGASEFQLNFFGSTLSVSRPFTGRLMAPAAAVVLHNLLPGQYRGSFFASSIAVTGSSVILPAGDALSIRPRKYVIGQAGPVGALPRTEQPRLFEQLGFEVPLGGGQVTAGGSTLTFRDNSTYRLLLGAASGIRILQGGDRPYVLLEGEDDRVGTFQRASTDPDRIEIFGVWLGSFHDSRRDLVIDRVSDPLAAPDFDWEEVVIRESTLDPGGLRADGSTIPPVRIVVRGRVRRLVIDRSIVGPIIVDRTDPQAPGELHELCIVDSLVDGSEELPQADGRKLAIASANGEVRMNGVTVFGDVLAERLVASDCIVTGGLLVADSQNSCFRYGATSLAQLPLDPEAGLTREPKFYRVPQLEAIQPYFFVSQRFGDPGYGQLSEAAPVDLHEGAESGSEMGVYSFTLRPIRLASVQAKVEEFQPVGIVPQYVVEGELPSTASFINNG